MYDWEREYELNKHINGAILSEWIPDNGSKIMFIDDPEAKAPIRTFDTGATRDTSAGKFEYDGFLSPYFLNDFARYMHQHRTQADGTLRDADNWQKGMPLDVYVSSAFRHFMDFWMLTRGISVIDEKGNDVGFGDAVMGLVFNLQGYWHETMKDAGEIRRSA